MTAENDSTMEFDIAELQRFEGYRSPKGFICCPQEENQFENAQPLAMNVYYMGMKER